MATNRSSTAGRLLAREIRRKRDEIQEALEHLSDWRIAEMCRVAEETSQVDGFPAGGNNGSSKDTAYGDPTGSAVAVRAGGRVDEIGAVGDDEWKKRQDPVREAVLRFKTQLSEVHGLVCGDSGIKIAAEFVLNRQVKERVNTIPDCLSCGDAIFGDPRNGLDEKCRSRYRRLEDPKPVLGEWIAQERARRDHDELAARQSRKHKPEIIEAFG